jgi:sterol 24-C-methyltransferase
MRKSTIVEAAKTGVQKDQLKETVHAYRHLYSVDGSVDARKSNSLKMVNNFYDLVTDFYEYGWGQSFHFAPRLKKESLTAALVRHEYYLALRTELKPGMKVLDAGCGVGGPARNICAFSGATVVGLNNNAYQIERAEKHTLDAGLQNDCSFVKGDFMNICQEDATYDAAYAIEATCHASDRTKAFSEIYRILKPSAVFAGYEWCVTDTYDGNNPAHKKIITEIEEGNGLPELAAMEDVIRALRTAGFEAIECRDLSEDETFDIPWYAALSSKDFSMRSLARTTLGRYLTHGMIAIMETLKIAPKGALHVSAFLNLGANALLKGGEHRIFSPLIFFCGRKPHVSPSIR